MRTSCYLFCGSILWFAETILCFINKINKLQKIFYPCKLKNTSECLSYNIAPTQFSTIISFSNNFFLENAKWGFLYIDKCNNEKYIINSRIETINEKIMFKESFLKRKCLIPSNGYFEWVKTENEKKPYFINYNDLDTIFFAGIWKYIIINNKKLKTFTIITKFGGRHGRQRTEYSLGNQKAD